MGKKRQKQLVRQGAAPSGPIYTLEVSLLEWPLPRRYSRKRKAITRTIEIPGAQTLIKLHDVIFEAFDREDDCHLYMFHFGEGPKDRCGTRYILPEERRERMSDFDCKVGLVMRGIKI